MRTVLINLIVQCSNSSGIRHIVLNVKESVALPPSELG